VVDTSPSHAEKIGGRSIWRVWITLALLRGFKASSIGPISLFVQPVRLQDHSRNRPREVFRMRTKNENPAHFEPLVAGGAFCNRGLAGDRFPGKDTLSIERV